MNITPNGRFAIIFARVWGVIAVAFGLFLIATIIDSLARQGFNSNVVVSVLVRLAFAALFIFAGVFFLRAKISVK